MARACPGRLGGRTAPDQAGGRQGSNNIINSRVRPSASDAVNTAACRTLHPPPPFPFPIPAPPVSHRMEGKARALAQTPFCSDSSDHFLLVGTSGFPSPTNRASVESCRKKKIDFGRCNWQLLCRKRCWLSRSIDQFGLNFRQSKNPCQSS